MERETEVEREGERGGEVDRGGGRESMEVEREGKRDGGDGGGGGKGREGAGEREDGYLASCHPMHLADKDRRQFTAQTLHGGETCVSNRPCACDDKSFPSRPQGSGLCLSL